MTTTMTMHVDATRTLLLSQGYEPVKIIPWQRAITLLFNGKVEVVDEYEDKTIRSVTFELKMPSVVRFLRFLKRMKPVIRFKTPETCGAMRRIRQVKQGDNVFSFYQTPEPEPVLHTASEE